MEEFLFITPRCILCTRQSDSTSDFKDINTTNVNMSKKSVKDVLYHLAKCIELEMTVKFTDANATYTCDLCYEKLVEYDKVMIQLLKHQKELTKLLKSSMNVIDSLTENNEIVIKQENLKSIESMSDNDDDGGYIDINVDNRNNVADRYESMDSLSNPPKAPYLCSICGKKLSSKYCLRTHLNSHARRCYICGVIRRDEEYLELHMNVHKGKTENECKYCPKKYSRRSHVIRHMHMHWDKKKFQCEKCGLIFSQSNLLYNHRMIHDAEEKPLVCDKCDQTFKSMRTYKHHMVTHQEDRPRYPCEVCSKMFTEKYTLKVHLKTHLVDPESIHKNKSSDKKKQIGKLSCIICDNVFVTQHKLDLHMVEEHHVISSAD